MAATSRLAAARARRRQSLGPALVAVAVGVAGAVVALFVGCTDDAKLSSTRRAQPRLDAGLDASSADEDGGGELSTDAGGCTVAPIPTDPADGPVCTTSVSGTVYAPNGTLPLYDVIAYVPSKATAQITHGATCDPCGQVSGVPVVATLSRADGTFTLTGVPPGKDVPLVLQIGKWRRQLTLPEVVACAKNVLPAELTRLPRTQAEGDLPRIALATGRCDEVGCVLPKVGIDPSEFGLASDGDAKSVHVYRTHDPSAPGEEGSAIALWNDVVALRRYDVVLLSCECWEAVEGASPPDPSFGAGTKGPKARAALVDYLAAGGRVFGTHYMYTWYRDSPDTGLASIAKVDGPSDKSTGPLVVDTCFPKGNALAAWLDVVAPGSKGRVPVEDVFHNIVSVDPTKARVWAVSDGPQGDAGGPRVFSVNMPVGLPAEQQCGKGVQIDAHVTKPDAGAGAVDATYPLGCGTKLLDTEKLLAFLFFDVASCIQNESKPPEPPK